MPNKPVLAVFFLATVSVAAGSAWAASSATSPAQSPGDASHAAMLQDLGKLSADASQGFRDLELTRFAIYNGDTQHAKTLVDAADAAFAKAKNDDSVFMKAESHLMTADQVAKTTAAKATAAAAATKTDGAAKIAWLPVDGAVSLDEDFTVNPTKAKAVDDANKSLEKGDRKGAIEKLELAQVSTSIVIEVVPRDQAVSDVHSAARLIDAGKYYEASQMLRKVQMAARYDLTDIVGTPKVGATAAAPSAHPAPAASAKTH